MSKTILFLHGYNDSSKGRSFQLFSKYLTQSAYKVISLDYDQSDCDHALEQIREVIDREYINNVIGVSLGGFLALQLKHIRRTLINPLFVPSEQLPLLAAHEGFPAPSPEMLATYAKYEQNVREFSSYEREHTLIYHAVPADGTAAWDQAFYDRVWKGDDSITPVGDACHLTEEDVQRICSRFPSFYRDYEGAHDASFMNRDCIRRSKVCGCFYCRSIFPARKVGDWISEGDGKYTALCPYCGIDSVIGNASGYHIDPELLGIMEWIYFKDE